MSLSALTLDCRARIQETHDVVSWQFINPHGPLPRVLAGQCITVHCQIEGKAQSRAYTLSSSPQDDYWQITVKDVGYVSHHLHQQLQVGDKIKVEGPFGEFHLTVQPSARPLLLSAGSGITPMWAILRDALAKQSDADIVFIHSARSVHDVIFGQALKCLTNQYPSVKQAVILEQSDSSYPWQGRLTRQQLQTLVPDLLSRDIYLCGPAPYMSAVTQLLAELGVSDSKIHTESFATPAQKPASTPLSERAHFWLTVANSGKKVKILPGQTLLAALEAAGEPIASACRAGVCGVCRCTTTGHIERQSVVTLSEQELAQGVVLACSCIAHDDIEVTF